MRTLAVATILGVLLISHPKAAQDQRPRPRNPQASPSQTSSAAVQESDAQAEQRKKAEALEKARQRRIDQLSRSICRGC